MLENLICALRTESHNEIKNQIIFIDKGYCEKSWFSHFLNLQVFINCKHMMAY